MKKIVSTTLIALAFAAISTVEAKRIRMVQPATTRTDLKNMVADAKDLLNPAVSPAEKKNIAQGLLGDLEAAGLIEYSKLLIKRKQIANELDAAKAKRDATSTGWLFDTDERREANQEVADLNTQLRDINKQIRSMEAEQSKETSNTAKVVVASVVATIGVLAAFEYYMHGEKGLVGRAAVEAEKTYRKYAPKRFVRSQQ